MASLNKVMLIGNLTRDPELRYVQSGMAVCDFGIAVNRKFRSTSGEQKEEVLFVDVTAWGKQAEVVSEFLQKGKLVFIEGRLKLDQWTGQDGQKRSRMSVVMGGFQFLDSRGGGGGTGGGARVQGARPQAGKPQGDKPQGGKPQGDKPQGDKPQGPPQEESRPPAQDDFDAGDDSIPF